jgi:predicted acetyltransferase
MIQFANEINKQKIRQMWKTCFDDSEEFMDIYFSEKYLNENTLIYFENKCQVASLQLLPYFFTFYGINIPVAYLSGVCTLPEFRKRGYMEKLLIKSLEIMKDRNIPISILIPADNSLCSYYEKFGFETVFDEGKESDFLKDILNEAVTDFDCAFSRFNNFFKSKDFCIQKTVTDFMTIVKDASISNILPKYNLHGMARLIDTELLLNIFSTKNPKKNFSIELYDNFLPVNNSIYSIKNGKCIKAKIKKNCFKITVNTLCRLLFGYRLEQFLDKTISQYFDSHYPILNLMLE